MTIDVAILIVWLAAIFATAIYSRRTGQRFASFARARNNQSRIILVATIFSSAIGGGTIFGITQKVHLLDLAVPIASLLLIIPIDVMSAKYLVPRIACHHGSETVGDILHKYYGLPGRVISGIATIIFSTGFLAAQISVSGIIFMHLLDLDYTTSIISSYLLLVTYTTIGGLQSILFTNLLQFITIIIAIPIIGFFGISKIGFGEFLQAIPLDQIMHPPSSFHLLDNVFFALTALATMVLYPTFIQRVLINDDYKKTQQAIYIKSLIYAIFLCLIVCNGLLSHIMFADASPSLALISLIDQIIPAGVRGIVVIGFISATMSTADSDINVSAVSAARDIIEPIFQRRQKSQNMLLIARIANIALGTGAIYLALEFDNIIDLVIFSAGFWSPIVLAPLIFALFNISVSRAAFMLSSSAGLGSFALWQYMCSYSNIKGVFVGSSINFLVFLSALIVKKVLPTMRSSR